MGKESYLLVKQCTSSSLKPKIVGPLYTWHYNTAVYIIESGRWWFVSYEKDLFYKIYTTYRKYRYGVGISYWSFLRQQVCINTPTGYVVKVLTPRQSIPFAFCLRLRSDYIWNKHLLKKYLYYLMDTYLMNDIILEEPIVSDP